MKRVGVIWDSEVDFEGSKPFDKDILNSTYSTLSELAKGEGFRVVISSFEEINGSELKRSYRFEDERWKQQGSVEMDAAIDKFRYDDQTINAKKELRSCNPTINPLEIETLAYDKLKTAREFPKITPETSKLNEENLEKMLAERGKVVVKPVFSHGGKGVKVIDDAGEVDIDSYNEGMIQEFIDTTEGINGLNVNEVHDLRIVGVGKDPVFAYVRTNDEGFVSNVSQGGEITMIGLEDIPDSAMEIFEEVAHRFESDHFIFGVDIAFDDGEDPVILEINSTPGLPWYGDPEVKESKLRFWNGILGQLKSIV